MLEKNKIKSSGGNGIFVDTAGNTFRNNKATKSEGFDLLDEAGAGANVYDGNKFGTQSTLQVDRRQGRWSGRS